MDLAFTRKKKGFVDVEPARLDHNLLRATLAAHRQAQVQETRPGEPEASEEEHLTELLVAGPSWREAAAAQGGCFSRAEAGRRVNDT